jgi:FkbM family methyltransferase
MASEVPWIFRMRVVLKPGMSVIDVGANEGLYTIPMAESVGPTGAVVALEPDPRPAAALRATLASRGFDGFVTVREAAAADVTGRRILYQHMKDSRQDSFAEVNLPVSKSRGIDCTPLEVETVTLDDVLATPPLNGHVDVVKLDCQGAETLILQGASRLLALPHLRMQLELWPTGLLQMGSSAAELFGLLQAAGFTPCWCDDQTMTYAAAQTLADSLPHPTFRHCNLIFLK